MFALRGLAVSLSVFVLVYCTLSIAVCAVWRHVWLYAQTHSARGCARTLFALRMFPLMTAAAVTLVFAVPSFLLLEPTAINEPIGEIPLALGCCGLALTCFGLANAIVGLLRARRTIAAWIRQSDLIDTRSSVPVLRTSQVVPGLVAAGILRPRVLVSGAAEGVLTPKELRIALEHELAHIRRRDNLKKLLLRLVLFPGMRDLEAAWQESTEMAADDAAVSSLSEALDLAAALIKMSRLSPVAPAAELTMTFAHSAADVVNARIARLIAWRESRTEPDRRSPWYGFSAIVLVTGVFLMSYSPLLIRIHVATEWLVR